MPQSKLAFFRYLQIDRMLRNKQKPYPNLQEMLDECHEKFGVKSVSTIEKDLSTMRIDFEAPIAYKKSERGYYYTDPSYKLLSVNLSDENLMALSFVESFLENFKALPIFEQFSDAVDKVLDGLEITKNFGKEARPVSQFIQMDKSPYLKGSETLSLLIGYINEKKVLRIDYQKFTTSSMRSYTVHPYLLKEFKGFWYLLGLVEAYGEVRTFGVDRITNLSQLEQPFKEISEADFDPQSFFRHCFGITVLNTPPEKILLKFTPHQGNYLKALPIHPTQSVVADDDQQFVISLEVFPNYELKQLLLSYGSNLEVLEPLSLRQAIAEELKKSLLYYE